MTAPLRSHPPARTLLQALVVDDDKFMLTVLTDHLRDLGIGRVATATDGSTARKAFDAMVSPPGLIVCDLNMPGSDGFQFMEHLAAKQYAGGVVLVSGMDSRVKHSASLMGRFHRLNILGVLDKPVDATALGAAIAKLA